MHYAHYLTIIRMMFLSYYYTDYRFPMLLYALFFFFIMKILAIEIIIRIIRIIDIIAIIYVYPSTNITSCVWLQILGSTAGMHSYTCEAAIATKILRNSGGRCTSVWAGTPKEQALSTVFDPQQLHERDAKEPHIWPNVYLADALLREPIRI